MKDTGGDGGDWRWGWGKSLVIGHLSLVIHITRFTIYGFLIFNF